MDIDQIVGSQVVEIAEGRNLGKVNGVIVDKKDKRVIAVAVTGGRMFDRPHYVRLEDIASVEHDVLTIPSAEMVVGRSSIPTRDTTDSIIGRRVITEDGKDLGDIRSYSIDPRNGDIQAITFAVDKNVLGGLWKTAGDSYTVPGQMIRTLGENVVVDNSVPDVVGMKKAA